MIVQTQAYPDDNVIVANILYAYINMAETMDSYERIYIHKTSDNDHKRYNHAHINDKDFTNLMKEVQNKEVIYLSHVTIKQKIKNKLIRTFFINSPNYRFQIFHEFGSNLEDNLIFYRRLYKDYNKYYKNAKKLERIKDIIKNINFSFIN